MAGTFSMEVGLMAWWLWRGSLSLSRLLACDRTGLFNGPEIPLKYKDHVTKRGAPLDSWNGTIVLDLRARDLKT